MGVIYKAFDQRLQRYVALKLLSAARLENLADRERFQQETRAASKLQHRHIVPVFGVGEQDGVPYYSMQFIAGRSLEAMIVAQRCKRLTDESSRSSLPANTTQGPAAITNGSDEQRTDTPLRDATCGTAIDSPHVVAGIALQIADALAYAHSQGVLHRDIKPSNLIRDNAGEIWITDFGLAKLEGAEALTRTGDVVGTLRYMAPERLEGWSDRRSDIYSLGATLYELLKLQPLFETSSRSELIHAILYERPVAPSKIAQTRAARFGNDRA